MSKSKNFNRKIYVTTSYVDEGSKEIMELWILRTLLVLQGHREFIDMRNERLSDDNLANFLGLEEYINSFTVEQSNEIQKQLYERLNKLEQKSSFGCSKILTQNVQNLSKLIGLNRVEEDILIFSIHLKYFDLLDNATRTLNSVTYDKVITILSVLLGYEHSQIKSVLSPKGKLIHSGVVTLDRYDSGSIAGKIELLSIEFAEKMMNHEGDIEEVIKDSVRKCTAAQLNVKDFEHLKDDTDLLIPYLQHVIKEQKTGVNILLYGTPGTGKTELTKAIAKELGVDIYEVSYADEDDEPITGVRRLRAYYAAQSILGNKKILLMFDEIEDVMSDDSDYSFFGKKKQDNKAWINRMLETNELPTIWITNDVYAMDRATIRRFDMSIEIPIPPKSKRKEILQNNYIDILNEHSIEKIAQNENIAPALVSRAAKVISALESQDIDKEKAVEKILNNTLKAQGHDEIKEDMEGVLPASYSPDFIHTDIDIKDLAKGMKKHQNARICLYGVPGTGKSAFGKWLARSINRPFILKKGSDLLSMWVGGTEKNIANAFREAKEENAVLIFDEVDSFLQDRRSAQRSWEVTQVNEMLVQMENYEGIFIATTNLMDGLDQASLRRFDLKLEFSYLNPKQSWKLFSKECEVLRVKMKYKKSLKEKVESMKYLTPGDFAAVRRQHRFRPIETAQDYIVRLRDEIRVKDADNSHKMGFMV